MNDKKVLNVEDLKKAMAIELRAHDVKAEVPFDFDNVFKKLISNKPKKKKDKK